MTQVETHTPSSNLVDDVEPGSRELAASGEPPKSAAAQKPRIITFVLVAIALLAIGVAYLAWAGTRVDRDLIERQERALESVRDFESQQPAARAQAAPGPTPEPTTVQPAAAGFAPEPGEVLVVNRVPGDDYGRLAIRHADGTRTLLERRCLRVHIANEHGVCLSQDDSVVPAYTTTFFPSVNPGESLKSYASALPSRARISPSGRFSSVTAFATGTSYVDIGEETTTFVTIDEIASKSRLRSTAQMDITSTDERYDNFAAQYWGITFVDDDEFYVTGYFGTAPEIMRGSLETMTMEPTGWIGSCPSISPDGKTLVFKEQRQDGGFDLVAVDVATQEKRPLGETRSVDDQVEWLDNDTILYALHPDGGDNAVQPEFDIWMLDIAPGSEPVLFLPNADSPAVAR